MTDTDRVRKLRWRCRRGMKELDILLERFLVNQAGPLGQGRWPALESLLEWEDDVFWDCVQDPNLAPDAEQRALLHEIRKLRVQSD